MKIKLLTSMAGTDRTHNVGDIVEFSDESAERCIAAGFAEAVDQKIKVTTPEKPETVSTPSRSVEVEAAVEEPEQVETAEEKPKRRPRGKK